MVTYPSVPNFDFSTENKAEINSSSTIEKKTVFKNGKVYYSEPTTDEIDLSLSQAISSIESGIINNDNTNDTSYSVKHPNNNPNLRELSINNENYHVVDTAIPVEEYAAYIQDNKLYQDAGFQDGQCMVLSQYYAVDMLRGKCTSKKTMNRHEGAPACRINKKCRSEDPNEVLQYCFDEINKGHPIVLQVTQANSYKGDRHLVTVVGFKEGVESWEDLTPENILVLDCYDGKIQSLGQSREEGGHERELFAQNGKYQALGPTDRFLESIGLS